MSSARTAAVVTWVYAAAFGVPAVPVSTDVVQNGPLPTLWGLFEMYGPGRWRRPRAAGTNSAKGAVSPSRPIPLRGDDRTAND